MFLGVDTRTASAQLSTQQKSRFLLSCLQPCDSWLCNAAVSTGTYRPERDEGTCLKCGNVV